jgi:hypothetical protein
MAVQYRFAIGETVFLTIERGGCCPAPNFEPLKVHAFFRIDRHNLYEVGLDHLIDEEQLLSESEMVALRSDELAETVECILQKLEDLGV